MPWEYFGEITNSESYEAGESLANALDSDQFRCVYEYAIGEAFIEVKSDVGWYEEAVIDEEEWDHIDQFVDALDSDEYRIVYDYAAEKKVVEFKIE